MEKLVDDYFFVGGVSTPLPPSLFKGRLLYKKKKSKDCLEVMNFIIICVLWLWE